MKNNRFLMVVVSLLSAVLIAAGVMTPIQAAAPVPSSPLVLKGESFNGPALFSQKVLTQSTNSDFVDISGYAACSLHYVIAQGSTPNTMTAALKVSNLATTPGMTGQWVSLAPSAVTAANVVTSNVTASVNDIYVFNAPPVKYARLEVTLGTTTPVTLTSRLFCVR